jgi:hypothetical protein
VGQFRARDGSGRSIVISHLLQNRQCVIRRAKPISNKGRSRNPVLQQRVASQANNRNLYICSEQVSITPPFADLFKYEHISRQMVWETAHPFR